MRPEIIVQCKRYSEYSDLKSVLKRQELPKVAKLDPRRYMLTTSVPLSPQQADDLKEILSPFVVSTDDIYGTRTAECSSGQAPGGGTTTPEAVGELSGYVGFDPACENVQCVPRGTRADAGGVENLRKESELRGSAGDSE
jgi:hypothetical protein